MMDIAKQSEEIIPVVNRLTLETLLKEMSYAAILMVVIEKALIVFCTLKNLLLVYSSQYSV